MKTISIVTVCKNEEKTIERTVLSVLSQTFSGFEYIIIDGGSSDNTLHILSKYTESVDKIISEKDEGIFDAQMKGLKNCTGEYVLFLNAGDYFCNNHVLEVVFRVNPGEDIVYGDIIYQLSPLLYYRKNSFRKISYLQLLIESIPHPSTIYKRELFERCGLFDLEFSITADYEFLLRAVFQFKASARYISEPFAVFNLEGLSMRTERTAKYKKELETARKKHIPENYIRFFAVLKPVLIFFGKKLRYLYYLIISIFSKEFLKMNYHGIS